MSSWSIRIGSSFAVRLRFMMPLELHELWITLALFNSLHFEAKCWSYGVKFSLTYNFTFDSKPSFDLSICEVSNFFFKIALQCFLFTKPTIVLFEHHFWTSSTSFFVIAIFIASKTSITFSFNFSSGICEGIYALNFKIISPCILLKFIARNFNFSDLFLEQFNFITRWAIKMMMVSLMLITLSFIWSTILVFKWSFNSWSLSLVFSNFLSMSTLQSLTIT